MFLTQSSGICGNLRGSIEVSKEIRKLLKIWRTKTRGSGEKILTDILAGQAQSGENRPNNAQSFKEALKALLLPLKMLLKPIKPPLEWFLLY
ncbi:hypothetical protein DPQ22_05260 [Candidatus Tokpelaia sp.]|nr:hypothetical protein DPQ22_05260 [Candidatus Tokpelaia sp.]